MPIFLIMHLLLYANCYSTMSPNALYINLTSKLEKLHSSEGIALIYMILFVYFWLSTIHVVEEFKIDKQSSKNLNLKTTYINFHVITRQK